MVLDMREGGLDDPRIHDLIRAHIAHCALDTQPGKCHRLDLDGLRATDIRFWSAWDGSDAIGMVALRALDGTMGELKSMHVRVDYRGQGIADLLLEQVMSTARALGLQSLALETGDTPAFAAARAFYARHGFGSCPPFGEYKAENAGTCMVRQL